MKFIHTAVIHERSKNICETSTKSLERANSSSSSAEKQEEWDNLCVAIKFAQITREYDARFFTGLPGLIAFLDIFNMLQRKALLILDWSKATCSENKRRT